MTLEFAKAFFGLSARATPAGTNVLEPLTIGVRQIDGEVSFADAAPDIIYTITIEANAASDVATLTLSSGAVAQTTGSPVATRSDGKDFEGIATPTLVTLYGLLIRGNGENGYIGIASSSAQLPDLDEFADGDTDAILPWINRIGITSPGTIAFSFTHATNTVEITVLGKSS